MKLELYYFLGPLLLLILPKLAERLRTFTMDFGPPKEEKKRPKRKSDKGQRTLKD